MQQARLKPDVKQEVYRVLRGGNRRYVGHGARLVYRDLGGPTFHVASLGFRLVRNITHEGELNVQDSSP